jgi:hypothetical protein
MKCRTLPRAASVWSVPLLVASVAFGQTTTLQIETRATYLRTNSDSGALPATAYPLSAFGLTAGGWCRIEQVGDWRPSNSHPDASRAMLGIFSTSSTLLSSSTLVRVPGGVGAGAAAVSSNTYFGGLTTDVAADFRIAFSPPGPYAARLRIPPTAQFVFFSPADQLFYDNSDPDGDCALLITPEPAPFWPGTGEDLEVATGVSAAATTGPGQELKFAVPNDALTISASSPFGTLAGEAALFGAQLVFANAPLSPYYVIAELWLDPLSPLYLPVLPNFGPLPAAATSLTLPVPAGLSGLGVVVQAVVVTPLARNGAYAAASAHVVVFL